ncbi:MAG TPA: phage BR0599 family protein [Verrucomicrobiae bacterium]|jgi:uncharacterized phage protein (TIGR02218 family)
MNYLGQPVFLFKPNWVESVQRSVTFELRPEDIGFGAEFYTPTANWTVNQWQFDVMLQTPALIAEFNAFTAAVLGPLKGFWLPIPAAAAEITAGTSNTVFRVATENLATFWQDRPDQYLFFTFADGSQAAAKIQSVVTDGPEEVVTLTTALPQIPDEDTAVVKLQFVRLSQDEEQGTFLAEGVMQRSVTVEELPNEYAAPILGLQPIYLFHFWTGAPAQGDWKFTSFAAPVVSKNELYQNFPINFSDLSDTADGSAQNLTIDAKPDPANPLMSFLPIPYSAVMFVEVFAIGVGNLDAQTLLFSGRVVSVEDGGSTLTATCENRLGYLSRKIPRYLKGQNCQNRLFDPATCKALRAVFETSVNIVAIADENTFPPTVDVTFLLAAFADKFKANDYLAQGLFAAGVGVNYEARTIVASSWNAGTGKLTLTLNMPLYLTNAGGNATITAGCDHTASTCKAKFNNFINFNGFIAIPARNPTLKAVNANPVSQGGK